MGRSKKEKPQIAVGDIETDPFLHGRVPRPFAVGLFDGTRYVDFWGKRAVVEFIDHIATIKTPLTIYFHNGGKFDMHFFLDSLENPIKIINGRIVSARIGIHEVRDSYAILPFPLRDHDKGDIDYAWFEESEREEHRTDILEYLARDCESLYKLVFAFNERFGPKLTIGGTAIGIAQKMHPFPLASAEHDAMLRPYYFGGRVQAFETGIIQKPKIIIDVNSMYPHVMRNLQHPCGRFYARPVNPRIGKKGELIGFGKRPFFISFIGKNFGALPTRTKDGLDFNVTQGLFNTTSHELQAGMRHGLIEIDEVKRILVPAKTICFDKYVDTFIADKIAGKLEKDKIKEIFAKLLLNSLSGKFGQNPDHYYDWKIIRDIAEIPREEWDRWERFERHGEFEIWRAPSKKKSFYDVAISASITGASRAILLDAIHSAKGVSYCDTDSLICDSFEGEISDTKLGAWKLEAECDWLAIAGKKLYAAFKDGNCVKQATKGVRLSPEEIVALCKGESVEWANDAPSFSLNSPPKFVKRKLTRKI